MQTPGRDDSEFAARPDPARRRFEGRCRRRRRWRRRCRRLPALSGGDEDPDRQRAEAAGVLKKGQLFTKSDRERMADGESSGRS